MIYYDEENLMIRNMILDDAQVFTDEEIAQGWNADISKYKTRLADQASGKAISLVALYQGKQAGYINIYPDSTWGHLEEWVIRK